MTRAWAIFPVSGSAVKWGGWRNPNNCPRVNSGTVSEGVGVADTGEAGTVWAEAATGASERIIALGAQAQGKSARGANAKSQDPRRERSPFGLGGVLLPRLEIRGGTGFISGLWKIGFSGWNPIRRPGERRFPGSVPTL